MKRAVVSINGTGTQATAYVKHDSPWQLTADRGSIALDARPGVSVA